MSNQSELQRQSADSMVGRCQAESNKLAGGVRCFNWQACDVGCAEEDDGVGEADQGGCARGK